MADSNEQQQQKGEVKSGGVDALAQIGVTGLRHSSGRIDEEWLPALRWDRQPAVYQEMGDSPHLGVALLTVETLLRRTDTSVTPADSTRESAVRCAERFDQALHDMDHTFQDHKTEMCSALKFGHAPFDVIWKRCNGMTPGVHPETGEPLPQSKYSDGMLTMHKLDIRSQDSIDRWEFAKDGTYTGFWQVDPNSYKCTFVPIGKCLHYRVRPQKNNPQGTSLLRPAYVPYQFAKKFQVIEAVGFEKNIYGIPVIEGPLSAMGQNADADQAAMVARIYAQLRNLRRDMNEGIFMPTSQDDKGLTGWKLTSFSGGGTERNMGIRDAVRDLQKDQMVSLLCGMLMLGMDKVGTQAAFGGNQEVLGMALETIYDDFLATFNAAIPRRFALFNGFNVEDAPYLTRGKIIAPSLEQLAAYFVPMLQSGGIVRDDGLENFFRSQGGAPLMDLTRAPAG